MPKIICTRPNASLNINGVNFTPTEDQTGVISEEVSQDVADGFLAISGYTLADSSDEPEKQPEPQKAAARSPAKVKEQKPAATDDAPADSAPKAEAAPKDNPDSTEVF